MKLGIDFGGVIIKPLQSEKLLFSNCGKEIMQEDVFLIIGKLNKTCIQPTSATHLS